MKLTREEVITICVVLDMITNYMTYEEANKYLGSITIERASALLDRVSKEIHRW